MGRAERGLSRILVPGYNVGRWYLPCESVTEQSSTSNSAGGAYRPHRRERMDAASAAEPLEFAPSLSSNGGRVQAHASKLPVRNASPDRIHSGESHPHSSAAMQGKHSWCGECTLGQLGNQVLMGKRTGHAAT